MDPDEVAHYEPPHQNLRCLQNQLFSSLVLKSKGGMIVKIVNVKPRVRLLL